MMKNQMSIYFRSRFSFIKLLVGLLLFNLFFTSLVFAQAKEPWKGAYTSPEFAGGAIRNLYCDLVGEVEGSFGALQFIVGGMMAFGYAVFGDTKKTYAIVAAGVVGATMSTGVSLYFGQMCGGATGQGQKTFSTAQESVYVDVDEDRAEDLF